MGDQRDSIDADDRVIYAEAMEITGYTHRRLTQLALSGALTRQGGGRGRTAFLSRSELEALALAAHRHGALPPPYWLTLTATGVLLGISRQAAHQAVAAGHIPAHRASNGEWLIRRSDALLLVMAETFPRSPGRPRRKT